jgi:hypothetical protein
MTLTGSGQISFNDLRVELGISSQSPFSITSASTGLYVAINTSSPSYPNSSAPHAISEWYSYNHTYSACDPLNSGLNFNYTTTGVGDPSDCTNTFNTEYPSSGPFYSTNCTTLAAGCTVYLNNTCTNSAYAAGVTYMTDFADYYTINSSTQAVYGNICTT